MMMLRHTHRPRGSVAMANLLLAAGLASVAVAAACATAPRVPTTELPSCQVNAEEGWREVRADTGFRFCVPVSWRASGSRVWRGGGGKVEWSVGSAPGPREIRVRVTTVPAGQGRPVSTPVQGPAGVDRLYDATESIHGAPVRVFMTRVDDTYHTGATWTRPRSVYLRGEAPSRSAALEQLEVYRTARVTAR